jgi:polyisoprenoid-binding protein YceI
MIKYTALVAAALILAMAITRTPVATTGSWRVDAGHSDAFLSTDATTDFGKTKINFTIGIARVSGSVKLDESNSANTTFDFDMYPASSMTPPINEEGKVRLEWFTHFANNTLVCFHSKGARQTADGRLQTTGNLVLTRVDRNVELTPNEAYAGPVYGPPMIHRMVREATFVFDTPTAASGALQTSGGTKVNREDFPQLLKAVMATNWPPVVEDKNCKVAAASEAYSGAECTGTMLMTQTLPEAPHAANQEDYPGPTNFNSVVGNQLTIAVHMRLTPNATQGATGN